MTNTCVAACAVVIFLPSFAFADDFEQGKEALDKKDYDLAIARFDAYIRENPTNVNAYCYRGTAYSGKMEYAKAIENYSQAIKIIESSVSHTTTEGISMGK